MPFTHRPYGASEPVDPTTSPEGPSSQPSGGGFVPPSVPPPMKPPMTPSMTPPITTPYGQAQPAPTDTPGWGSAYGGQHLHKGASTARTLGIVALASAGIALFCCVTLPGVFCAPFAWVVGVRARNEIDRTPGVYANRGQAEAGIVMGIIGTVLSVLVVAVAILLVVLLASWNWTLV